jgi:hypothetical protein
MSYEEDVRFVGAMLRGGDWEVGLRIARNVDPTKGTAHRVMLRPEHERVSVRQFADDAKAIGYNISPNTVAKYLAAWEWAAHDMVVPFGAELTADTEIDWIGGHERDPDPKVAEDREEWSKFYAKACKNPPPWNPTGKPMEPRKAPSRHVGRKTLIDAVKDDPSLIAEAIKEDPATALRAREAIAYRDSAAKQRNTDRHGKQETPMEQLVGLHVQLRSAKRTLTEALGFVIDLRGITDTDEVRAAVSGYVEQLRHVLDLIDEAAQGKSLDDELAQLLQDEELQ